MMICPNVRVPREGTGCGIKLFNRQIETNPFIKAVENLQPVNAYP